MLGVGIVLRQAPDPALCSVLRRGVSEVNTIPGSLVLTTEPEAHLASLTQEGVPGVEVEE